MTVGEDERSGHVVQLRGWPGLDGWKPPPSAARFHDRLTDRNGLVLFAARKAGHNGDEPPILAALEIAFRSVIAPWLVLPDDLRQRDHNAYRRLVRWAGCHYLSTTTGDRPWGLATMSAFFEPFRGVFARASYSGCGFVVGADLGCTFGLVAAHAGARRGKRNGSWLVWLPGWGRPADGGRWCRVSPNRPALYVTARRVGWQVEFGPCGKDAEGNPYGRRVHDRMWRGAFLDVLSLAYALGGQRGASFADHCERFGVAGRDLPVTVTLDSSGADRLAEAVGTIRALALALDDRSAYWFTTAEERAQSRGRIDLCRTVSPGSLAQGILSRFGVDAPLAAFDLSGTEHAAWTESFHGGWCEAVR